MKRELLILPAAAVLAVSACKKPAESRAADGAGTAGAPRSTVSAAPPAAATDAEPTAAAKATPQDADRAKRQAKLDFATMEDGYINDSNGQWATTAKASSAYGNSYKPGTDPGVCGAPDGKHWTNHSPDIGFEWVELSYDRPVSATEVRVVFDNDTPHGVRAINKIELIDNDGQTHSVWSGLSDAVEDKRGGRTWFVRKFESTPYLAKGVRVTIANAVDSGYKYVDAVQLVGK
ncbi:hypothetical protein [Archangium sp.]|jgi:hypothetical protein|uniref:hypothetical protein n=1 Tax=Archangium sp. TaxID=1872627 RepID=UPI002ED7FD3B